MDGFARYSSSLLLLLAPALGCVEELPPIEGTTSLRVVVTSPADLGSRDQRLPDDARDIVVSITAVDAAGNDDTGFSGQVDFYAQHLGSLSPALGSGATLATINLTGGKANDVAIELPTVYGPTFLWAENARGAAPTYATGTSETMWFRDPWISDISRPVDEMSLTALERSPLEEKQVVVHTSRYGDRGRLVATGAYAQGYTLSDVECADANGTPPCTTGDYDHVYIYSFSRPEAHDGKPIRTGQVIAEVNGGVSEFNGLTEVGFPRTVVTDDAADPARVPEPVVIQPGWLDTKIEMERVESGLVAIEDAELCPLDEDFETYGQWKLDVGKGCRDAINIITTGQVAEFDPEPHVGETLPRVVGTLRPVNIGSFHVWIVYPRAIDDITLP